MRNELTAQAIDLRQGQFNLHRDVQITIAGKQKIKLCH